MLNKKLILLLLVSSFVFATAIGHVKFDELNSAQYVSRSIDLVFFNGFETSTSSNYSSDNISPITNIPAIETGSEKVGAIAGSFQTDQMGQANYSIAILTGAATAGLAPQVSLNYSSATGNGPLGVGWSISGTTIIARCRETQESRDEATTITPQPLSWDDDDKLCLNGERLYLVTGINYWDDLSTYRTERDQFARITYIGSSESFTIQRKDGSIAYYGDTTDSNIQATDITGSPTYAWAISRLKDNVNNYIDYGYTQFGDLEFVLSDIDYTGHLGSFEEEQKKNREEQGQALIKKLKI